MVALPHKAMSLPPPVQIQETPWEWLGAGLTRGALVALPAQNNVPAPTPHKFRRPPGNDRGHG